MIFNPVDSPEHHDDEPLRIDRLEEGDPIPDGQLTVTTRGKLSKARDNAILITTWYSGTHQIWRGIYVSACRLLTRRRRSCA